MTDRWGCAYAPELHEQPDGAAIRVLFKFVPREDWLPYDRENLWAVEISEETAQIKNVAFLQDGVAVDDVVQFQTDDNGVHWALGRVSASGRCVVRVVPFPEGPMGGNTRAVHGQFAKFGLGGESFNESFPMVAFDVPANADFTAIKSLLESGAAQEWWDYEVGCGTDAWWNA